MLRGRVVVPLTERWRRREAGARLRACRDGRIVITDLGSTNGTLLNGRRVTQAEVHAGDDLRLGEIVLPL